MASSSTVHPEFERWSAEQKVAASGEKLDRETLLQSGLTVKPESSDKLVKVAAKLSSGFFRPTKRTSVVWTEGDSELEVSMEEIKTVTQDGLIIVFLSVRCDQTGVAEIEVVFATGGPGFPAGAYASTLRRPRGPELIVDVWGDALVAYAWQIVLTLVSQIAGAAGKDERGNRLIPAKIEATDNGLTVVPMPRHRFFGSTGLLTGKTS